MTGETSESRRLLIGDLLLDTGLRRVSRDGQVVELPKLSYHLLLALAEASPNVLGQEELIAKVWPGRIVTPETVTQRIKLTRKALGDSAHEPRYIGLVRGEGYRLVATVEVLPREEQGAAAGLMAELKRRRVLQVALVYAAIAWSITEVVSFLLDALPVFPEWVKPLVAILFVVGFPVAMFLAWRFDLGPYGVRRTQATTRKGQATIAVALLLLVGATAGLFYLIYPSVLVQNGFDDPLQRVAIAPNSLAVMPFGNASGDADNDYISEGLADHLRIQFGQIPGFRIAAATSSSMFREQPASAMEIASLLRVEKLIEGQLTRQGDTLRINVQIIDGSNGFQTWSQGFERSARDLFAVQQDIANEIAKQLQPDSNRPFRHVSVNRPVPSAYALLLRAHEVYKEVREQPIVDLEKLGLTIDLLREATELDPDSALAHGRLGAALLYRGDVQAADVAITRALAINPDISEVQYTLGLYNWRTYTPGTGDAYARAVELDPNNADAHEAYGKWIWHQKDYTTPEKYLLKALELDPRFINRYADLGTYYGMSGMRDKALGVADDILREFRGAQAYLVAARILELAGNVDEAIAWALRAKQADPDHPDPGWMLAELYARIGDFDAARQFESDRAFNLLFWERRYEELIDLGDELVLDHPNQVQIWYGLVRAHLALGQYELAIYILEKRGLPGKALGENRRANDQEALAMYADALNHLGETATAREHAEWLVGLITGMLDTGGNDSWWGHLYIACAKSTLGRDDEALHHLETMSRANGLTWYPVLRDAPCFRKYADEPRYRDIVTAVEARMQKLRDRLPDTLARLQSAYSENP